VKKGIAADAPVRAELADAHALRALRRGAATPEQQQRALDWILTGACDVAGFQWRESARETDFALGRLFVGKQIGRLLTCDLSGLRRQQHVDSQNTTGTSAR